MLTSDRLHYLLTYDPVTGSFVWNHNRPRCRKGAVAGCITEKGHRRIELDGSPYRAARLAWLYMTGEWPVHQVDHKDPNQPGNDSWDNLRLATSTQNKVNQRLAKNNKTGFKGVYLFEGRYRAMLARKHIGLFDTIEEAYAAYRQASIEKYGEFHRDA